MAYALITGSSKGIGEAIARDLARRKFDLLLVARSGDLLSKLAEDLAAEFGIQAHFLSLDLSEQHAASKVTKWCTDAGFDVSILVNNAGYALWGYFEKLKIEDQLNMIQLNTSFLVDLTHRMIPILQRQKPSYILNVSSTTAYQPVPTLSVYAATKSFVLSFSHGLRHELSKNGISVSCLSPGSTDTDFMDRAGMEAMKSTAEKFSMTPEAVAQIAVSQMLKGKAEIIPGNLNSISSRLSNLLPSTLSAKTAASIYEKHLNKD